MQSQTTTKSPNALDLGGYSEGAKVSPKQIVPMKTLQRYATLQRIAMHTEQPAPADPVPQNPESEFFHLYGTLMNVYHLTQNAHFAGKYPCVSENALSQLTADLSHSLSQLDPLILEALASYLLHD